MHPIFVSIPVPEFLARFLGNPFQIHTYGVLIALGFFLAIGVVSREGERRGLSSDMIANLLFGNILWGVIGSRLLFVMLEWRLYVDRPLAILNIREGGLVFQGGLVCAVVYSIFFLRKNQLPFWKVGDVVVLGIPLGHLFGRLGCFAAGCCFGQPTEMPWAVTFSDPLAAGPPLGVPIHPVQLYESFGNLLIFAALYFGVRPKQKFDGQLMLLYFISYPLLRIVTELFRGDVVRGFLLEPQLGQLISTSQFISLLELVAAVAFFRWRRSRAGAQQSEPPSAGPLPSRS